MNYPNLSSWNRKPELEGVLFFAQLVDELLFDYTIDTYKIPALNSRTLAYELLSSIENYESNILKYGALKPIIMELVNQLEKDPVIREIISDYFEEFIKFLRKEQPITQLKTQVEFLINKINENYFSRLQEILKQTVRNPKEKEKIARLARLYIIELIYCGYSPRHIYFETNKFFFKQSPNTINDPQIIDSYLRLFSLDQRHFNVMYRTAKTFGTIGEFASDFDIEFCDPENMPSLKFSKQSKKIEEFLGDNEEFPCYLIAKNIESFDPIKARTLADEKLFLIDSLAKYHVHRRDLKRGDYALVYTDDQKEFVILRKPQSAVLKRPDKTSEKLPDLVRDTVSTITSKQLDSESVTRLLRVFGKHNNAIRSENSESQLLEFWAAIEVLFPPLKQDVDRIIQISDSIVPFIASKYAAKLGVDLYWSIKRSGYKEALEILSAMPEGDSEIEKSLALFSIEENKPLREKFYQLFKWHPLLKNRIYLLKEKFSSADRVLKTLRAHIERVSWQIQRIYRTRNIIIHSGRSVSYVNTLVENLHSYLDRVLDLLTEKISRSTHAITIDQISLEIRLQSDAHLRLLEGFGKTECTPENYKLILFGNK